MFYYLPSAFQLALLFILSGLFADSNLAIVVLAVAEKHFKREVKGVGKIVSVNLAPAAFIPGSRRADGFLVWVIKSGADGFCYRD